MKDKNIAELRQVAQTRMREGELRPLESDIKILEMKISHAKKNKEYEVNRSILAISHDLESLAREREKIEVS